MRFSALIAAIVAAVTATGLAAAQDVQLHADAGLGGLARPGRWMLVRITVQNGSTELSGNVVVEWGDARARRPFVAAAGARRAFDLYVRTNDVRESVTARIESDGRTVATLDVPLRIIRYDEPFVVCADGGETNAVTGTPSCAARLSAESTPSSWRGFDAADDVVVRAGNGSFSEEQRQAIALWRQLHAAEDASLVQMPTAAQPRTELRSSIRTVTVAYLAIVMATLLGARRFLARPIGAIAAIVAVAAASTAVAFAIGQTAPGNSIVVRYTGTLNYFPGAPRCILAIRAVADYPDDADFDVRAQIDDGTIESRGVRDARDEQRYDESGYPILRGRFALGAQKMFDLEGSVALRAVDMAREAGGIRVTNVSGRQFEDCHVTAGYTQRSLEPLAPTSSVRIANASDNKPSTMTCNISPATIEFSESGHPVATEGRLTLVVHLGPSPETLAR